MWYFGLQGTTASKIRFHQHFSSIQSLFLEKTEKKQPQKQKQIQKMRNWVSKKWLIGRLGYFQEFKKQAL